MTFTLQLGIDERQRDTAARLYWEAFGSKLGRVMGPEAKALAYLNRVIRCDHAVAALQDGQLIGLAGFKSPLGGFADGGWHDMRAVYGTLGAVWRLALLMALTREVDNRRFLVDGICVAHPHRGQGVGAALLGGLCDVARARGYGAVRLEVVDTNLRARALYQRQGFRVTRRDEMGVLRHAFGFAATTTMICDLA